MQPMESVIMLMKIATIRRPGPAVVVALAAAFFAVATVSAQQPSDVIQIEPAGESSSADAAPAAADNELRLIEGILNRDESTPANRQDAVMLLLSRNSDAARNILRQSLTRSDKPEVQLAILSTLASHKKPDEALLADVLKIAAGNSLAPRVQEALPRAIAAYRDDASIDAVVQSVLKSTQPSEQAILATALGITGEKMAVEPMIKLLGSESAAVREAASGALRSITTIDDFGDSAAKWSQWWEEHRFEPREKWLSERLRLVGAQLSQRDQQLAEAVKRAVTLQATVLKSLPAEERIVAVQQLMDDPVAEMRRLAVQESRRIVSDQKELPNEFIEKLLLRLADGSPAVRIAAAEAVSRLADNSAAADQLMNRLTQETESAVRGAVVDALGELRHGPCVPQLVELLKSDDTALVTHAAQALGRIGERGTPAADSIGVAIDPLTELLSRNGDEQGAALREAAVRALMKFGREDVAPALVKALGDQVATIRLFAAQGLGHIGKADDRTLNALLKCLSDSDKGVRLSVADSIGRISRGEGVASLAARLNPRGGETEPEVRAALWRSLLEIQRRQGDYKAIEALADDFAGQASAENSAGAAQLYELAISKLTNGERERAGELKLKLAEAHVRGGQTARAVSILRELLAAAADGAGKLNIQDRLGRLLLKAAPYTEGVDLMTSVAEARQGEGREAAIGAIAAQSRQLIADGKSADALAVVRRARSRLGKLYEESGEAAAMNEVLATARRDLLKKALKDLGSSNETQREQGYKQAVQFCKDEPAVVLKELKAALEADDKSRAGQIERLLPHVRPDNVEQYQAAENAAARLELVSLWLDGV